MKTLQFTYNVGANPGYGHNNDVKKPLQVVGKLWQEEASEVYESDGIYIGGFVVDGKTIYHLEWGCPVGGEDTVYITGLLNPEFLADNQKAKNPNDLPSDVALEAWKNAVRKVATAVGKRLRQSTGYLTFDTVDFEYLKLKEQVL